MDVNKPEKILLDEITTGYNPNLFMLMIRSGEVLRIYCLDPAGAKSYAESLNKAVTDYEKQFGAIDNSQRPVNLVSPFQPKRP